MMKPKLLILLSMLLWFAGSGTADSKDEYVVKSLLLEKFARYIRWPGESGMQDKTKPFVIGVLGKSPFGPGLDDIYAGKRIKGKKVKIKYINTLRGIYGCHILFVPSAMEKILSRVLAVTRNKPILTIGDTAGFAEKGVQVNLYFDGNKIRFEINESACRDASLTVDSLLLQIARIVKSPQNVSGAGDASDAGDVRGRK